MATSETPRFGLPQWSEDTDPITREQFNSAFEAIDDSVANHPNVTYGHPARDAFQIVNENGTNVLMFSDGAAWYHAANTSAGEPVPIVVVNNTIQYYSEGDNTWYVVSFTNATSDTYVTNLDSSVYTIYNNTTDETYTVQVTYEASDNIITNVDGGTYTYFNESDGTWYTVPTLPSDGPNSTVPLEVNSTGDTPTLDFYDADTEAWYPAGSGEGGGGAGADIRIQSDEPMDPDPGTIWVIPSI